MFKRNVSNVPHSKVYHFSEVWSMSIFQVGIELAELLKIFTLREIVTAQKFACPEQPAAVFLLLLHSHA